MATRRCRLEHQGKGAATQERWPNEWHDIEHQGVVAKAPPCPERSLRTPLPQQSSSSTREEEGHWVLMEDRRRRNIAFEKLGQGNAEIAGES